MKFGDKNGAIDSEEPVFIPVEDLRTISEPNFVPTVVPISASIASLVRFFETPGVGVQYAH